MMRPVKNISQGSEPRLAALSKDDKGIAAVEFALILPLMLLMLLGTLEVSNLITADRRAAQAASTLADLVARDDSITEAEVNDIFFAANAVFGSLPVINPQLVITSIEDNAGTARVAWSRAKNTAPDSAGSTISGLPTGLIPSGGSVLRVRVTIPFSLDTLGPGKSYVSTKGSLATDINYSLPNTRTISQTMYQRPRQVAKIPTPTP